MIKAVFIDFYGTLAEEDDKIVSSIIDNIVNNSNIKLLNRNDVAQYWWKEFVLLCDIHNGSNFKLQKEIEYVSLNNTAQKFNSNISVKNELEKMFEYWRRPAVFPDSIIFLEKIKLPVIIVSNIDNNEIQEAVKNGEIRVDKIITSEDALCYKPNKKIFETAMENNGLNANEIIHIGDSISNDIVGANRVNIKTIWLNRTNKKNKTTAVPNLTARNFFEIIEKISVIM
jgi:2-haloacid dehalogenase/putative hydrolase of the HAD superfamily